MLTKAAGQELTAAELLRRIHEARRMADEALRKAAEALSEGERLRR